MRRRLIILGSTGSIGTQTLAVVAHLNALHARGESPVGFEVVGLAAGRSEALLHEQGRALGRPALALADGAGEACAFRGPGSAERLVREVECDMVVAAMVGVAGLPATLAAVELGRDVALANKETLVAAGALVVPLAERTGARLLPVDSEHAAVWQCLAGLDDGRAGQRGPPLSAPASVSRVILTASGGPFRGWDRGRVHRATPSEALKHPTWNMGRKVTVDSASLTNKALELIEAHWLFGLEPERLEAVVHPQSVVHCVVEFRDGSSVAQLARPDMRGPIQQALAHPHRPEGCAARLDWRSMPPLEFEGVNADLFPAVGLAYGVMRAGGTAGAVFNAANEAAVESFLAPGATLPFGRIAELVSTAMEEVAAGPVATLGDVLAADAAARESVRRRV